jgi:2-polyprenyl-3-methyl-5-hydroxy-6-metoxy-1,4-benzoquinol methylase
MQLLRDLQLYRRMTETGSCLVCGSTDLAVLFTARDPLVSGDNFVLKRCNACGFTFTANPPDEEDIAKFYVSEDYISHSDKKQSLTDHVYHLARNYMLRKKYNLVCKVSGRETGSLVDIGSGTGYFADYMNGNGWNVKGIELSEQARQYSISKFGLTIVSPSEVSALKDGSIDCITLWHVLEHLYDPVLWLKEIMRILKDDGKCIIALPNIKSADAKWFNNEWAALDVPRHLWHFSPETLLAFIKEHGFKCIKVIPMPLDIYYISTLSYKNRGCKLPLMRGIVTGLFLTVRSLTKKNRASSLIYVISKQRG